MKLKVFLVLLALLDNGSHDDLNESLDVTGDYEDFDFTGLADDVSSSESECEEETSAIGNASKQYHSIGNSTIQIDNELPKHEFVKREHLQKTGKNVGKKKVFVSLVQEPYMFKRKLNPKGDGVVTFTCNDCAKLDKHVAARAYKTTHVNDEMLDEYELQHLPDPCEHLCSPSGVEVLVKKCTQEMLAYVARDPTTYVWYGMVYIMIQEHPILRKWMMIQ